MRHCCWAIATACWLLLEGLPATAFSTVASASTHGGSCLRLMHLQMTSGSNDDEDDNEEDGIQFSYNPIENETPEERESRMKLVRELQKSFYKDEETPKSASTNTNIIENLPLWRVQWTELPGSQNVLNVHVPHYTNMFQKILKGQTKAWGDDENNDLTTTTDDLNQESNFYFGHIFLPKGSENLDNPEYELQVGDVGTLMKISDSRQQSDGRLTLVVQALERFEISNVIRSHSPYGIADVKVCVDREQQQHLYNETDDPFGHHPFEYRTVSIEECEITGDDGTVVGLRVSPLSNYDNTTCKEMPLSVSNNKDCDQVLVAESDVWIALDTLLKLLRIANNGAGVPVPTQLLGLLPRLRSTKDDDHTIIQDDWPPKYSLETFANGMQEKYATVGTYSKSPFVRVDDNKNYSPLRRAQRFSYVVWTLTDSIVLPESSVNNKFSPENILKLTSTLERLELALDKIQKISQLLKRALRMQGLSEEMFE